LEIPARRAEYSLTESALSPFQAEPTHLHLIYLYCGKKNYPELNSIVVNHETGFPGDKYPDDKGTLGFLKERARVFTFNWAAKDKPRKEDFEAVRSATA